MSLSPEVLAVQYSAYAVPPGVDTVAQQPFLFNSLVVIPLNTVTNASGNPNVLVYRANMVRVNKATGQAWTPGAKIYWDNTNKVFTTTSTSNTVCGRVRDAALSADTIGVIDLDPAQT